MQSLKFLASTLAVALVLCAAAFSKDANSGNFDLGQTAQVGSTVLQPGHYKAEWTGTGSTLKVSILKNGKTIATTEGSIKELPAKSPYDAVTLKTVDNNTQQVDEIDFNNRSEALVLSGM
jgi:hypothetical protein